jgi:hypothetical protein
MNQHGKRPEQPEINDPPPSETGGTRGDDIKNFPADGVPMDDGTEIEGEMPLD